MIVTNIASQMEKEIVQLTSDLVKFPTSCNHPKAINQAIEYITKYLKDVKGVELSTLQHGGITSFMAMPKNNSVPDVLFCAHLDVVTLTKRTQYRARVEGGKIWGPGAGDMKGALAICLHVFKEMHQKKKGLSLGYLITTDEERGGEFGVKYLFQEKGLRCGVAIIPDSGTLNKVTVDEKGLLHLKISCCGIDGHACRPWLAENPLQRLVSTLTKIQKSFEKKWERLPGHWHPTFSLTIIKTDNEANNRIPQYAEAVVDIRFTRPLSGTEMVEFVEQRLEKDTSVKIIVSGEPSHFSPDPLFVDVTEKITGKPVERVRAHGASDARFITALGIPVIMSRPEVGNIHSDNEWIDISDMVTLRNIYREYLSSKFKL